MVIDNVLVVRLQEWGKQNENSNPRCEIEGMIPTSPIMPIIWADLACFLDRLEKTQSRQV